MQNEREKLQGTMGSLYPIIWNTPWNVTSLPSLKKCTLGTLEKESCTFVDVELILIAAGSLVLVEKRPVSLSSSQGKRTERLLVELCQVQY